jgi:hypothetical protein
MKKGAASKHRCMRPSERSAAGGGSAETPPVMLRDLIPSIAFAQPAAFPSISRLPQPLHSRLRSE